MKTRAIFNVFNGKFFANRKVTLEGTVANGKVITGWDVTTTSSTGTVSNTKIDGSRYVFVMPECSSLAINAIVSESTGVSDMTKTSWTWKKMRTQLVVSGVPAGTKIQLYNLSGISLYSGIADGSDMTIPTPSAQIYVLKVGPEVIKL